MLLGDSVCVQWVPSHVGVEGVGTFQGGRHGACGRSWDTRNWQSMRRGAGAGDEANSDSNGNRQSDSNSDGDGDTDGDGNSFPQVRGARA